MTTINSFLTACLLTAVALLCGTACVMQGDQSRQPGTSGSQAAPDSSPAARAASPPQVNFPADRNPSWITSVYEQEVQNEQAAAELAKMGFEFSGKLFLEQVYAGNRPAVELFLSAGMPPDMRSPAGITALMVAVESDNEDIARLLVERGADVTLRESRTTEMTALLYAARGGSADLIGYLLDHGADVNECDARLETSLYTAMMEQREDIVRILLERGAQVDFASVRNTTPLTYATGYPSLAIVRMLVEAGADPNATDGSGSTPLLVAAKFGQTANFNYLLEQGATNFGESATGYNALHAAAESGSIEIASQLVARGFDINLPDSRSAKTPLTIAVAFQRLEMAEWLLANGADPLPRCIFGYSAINLAERLHYDVAGMTAEERESQHYPDAARALALLENLNRQVTINQENKPGIENLGPRQQSNSKLLSPDLSRRAADSIIDSEYGGLFPAEKKLAPKVVAGVESLELPEINELGRTQARQILNQNGVPFSTDSFIEACLYGYQNLFKLFINSGIDVDARVASGANALSTACLRGDIEQIDILLGHNATLDAAVNDITTTSIQFAARSGNPAAVELLLSYGAAIDATDLSGVTALMEASHNGESGMVEYLLSKGANASATDIDGRSALHRAVVSGSLDTVKLLIAADADPNLTDTKSSVTPLALAVLFGNLDITKYLLSHGAEAQRKIPTSGATLMHLAAISGNIELVKLLLSQGLDLNARDAVRSATPLLAAVERLDADPTFIQQLLALGAEVNIPEQSRGLTPLLQAALYGQHEICAILVANGSDLNATALDGMTVLHAAVYSDNPTLVANLLKLGIDPELTDGEGKTPLERAIETNGQQVIPVLEAAVSPH